MKIIPKWLSVPTGERLLEAVELWEVRWLSRNGPYHMDTKPEVEVFPVEEAAVAFKNALEAAFELIRHTNGTHVEIRKKEPIDALWR